MAVPKKKAVAKKAPFSILGGMKPPMPGMAKPPMKKKAMKGKKY